MPKVRAWWQKSSELHLLTLSSAQPYDMTQPDLISTHFMGQSSLPNCSASQENAFLGLEREGEGHREVRRWHPFPFVEQWFPPSGRVTSAVWISARVLWFRSPGNRLPATRGADLEERPLSLQSQESLQGRFHCGKSGSTAKGSSGDPG